VLKTDIPIDKEWDDCCYHQDLTYPPARFLDNGESPITLYFAIDNQNLNLDLQLKRPKTGRLPNETTITLNPGDILLFNPCSLKHRTSSKPTNNTTSPIRVNIVMTGLEDFLTFDDVDGTLEEEELDPEPKKKRSIKDINFLVYLYSY
jgi:hypothetical protein